VLSRRGCSQAKRRRQAVDKLSADDKTAVILLHKHLLVRIDNTSYAEIHGDTARGAPKGQRPVLVAVRAAMLASKLLKFDDEKPANFLIGRRSARHTPQ